MSREKFALNIFEEELKYQKGQRKELLASAKTLDDSVKEDNKTLEQLKRESEYLVGNELTDKQIDMESVEKVLELKRKMELKPVRMLLMFRQSLNRLKKYQSS